MTTVDELAERAAALADDPPPEVRIAWAVDTLIRNVVIHLEFLNEPAVAAEQTTVAGLGIPEMVRDARNQLIAALSCLVLPSTSEPQSHPGGAT